MVRRLGLAPGDPHAATGAADATSAAPGVVTVAAACTPCGAPRGRRRGVAAYGMVTPGGRVWTVAPDGSVKSLLGAPLVKLVSWTVAPAAPT